MTPRLSFAQRQTLHLLTRAWPQAAHVGGRSSRVARKLVELGLVEQLADGRFRLVAAPDAPHGGAR